MSTLYTDEKIQADKEKEAVFRVKQQLPYEAKIQHAIIRAREFHHEMESKGKGVHVSVGGLDSITLFLFLHSIGIKCCAISASSLEDKSIVKVHKALGVENVPPEMSKTEVLKTFGYPILSKEIANKIHMLQHPSEENKTTRHAILTGQTGEFGGYRVSHRMKLSQKWLKLFGGADAEGKAMGYQEAPFKVSDRCCEFLKERPCEKWAKEHNSRPYTGLMASEHGRRERILIQTGCNYYGKNGARSCPFAIFQRNDLLRLSLEMDKYYHEHWTEFSNTHLDTIIPEIYGEIQSDENGNLYTTGEDRTGCSMCGFGIQLEKRPNRFDNLFKRNPREWAYWMIDCGWGEVLDYIGIGWRNEGDDIYINERRCKNGNN